MSDVTPVAPSATPDTISASEAAFRAGDQSAFKVAREAERAGTPLDPVPADQPADAAPAEPAAQAEGTPSPNEPASEPGKTGHKGNAETRKAQLQAEINDLLATRARLRQEVQPAPIQPTKPAAPAAATAQDDPEPTIEQFADKDDPYLELVRATARWNARQEAREIRRAEQQRTEAAEREQSVAQRAKAFNERLTAEHAKDPKWLDAISPEVQALRPFHALQPGERADGYNAVAEEIVRSDRPADLMKHFTAHPDELHEIAGMPPRELLRAMGRLEARLDAPAPPPPPKTLTSAPRPPVTVGTRATEPADAELAAVAAGDMTALRAARRQRAASAR